VDIHRLAGDVQLTVNWVPSHVGIAGNELADSLAVAGAGGPHVEIVCRPPLCFRKSGFVAKCWELFSPHFLSGSSQEHFFHYVGASRSFDRFLLTLPRGLQVPVTRLRICAIPRRAFRQCNLSGSSGSSLPCPDCGISTTNFSTHALFVCPRYAGRRAALLNAVPDPGNTLATVTFLLSTRKGVFLAAWFFRGMALPN
jgi:hypothetical protein